MRRLRLIRDARLLGLPLTEIRTLVEQAFASDCATFVPQLTSLIAAQRTEIGARIEALQRLSGELGELERHVSHAPCADEAGRMVVDCDYCLPAEIEERR